jgi:DNA-binding PadR family transcriptional regulator
VLIRFYQKRTWAAIPRGRNRKKEIVFDNTGLSFTYTEAEALGIGESTFYRAIKRLVELGFIDIEYQGGGLGRDYSRYALSERWRDYGTPSFKEVKKRRVLQPGLDVNSRIQKRETKQKKLSRMTTLSCQI